MSNSVDFEQLAQQVAQNLGTGIDWKIIYAQWRLETNDFTNWGSTVANNAAGMKQFKANPVGIDATSPEGDNYQVFDDWNDFADYYSRYLSKYFPDAAAAQTTDQFAEALKAGGYFGGSLDNYKTNLSSLYGDDTKITSSDGQTYKTEGAINALPAGGQPSTNQSMIDKITSYVSTLTGRVLKVIAGFVVLMLGFYVMIKSQPQVVVNKKEEE